MKFRIYRDWYFRYFKEKINELRQEKNQALANAAKYKVRSINFFADLFNQFYFSGTITNSSFSI
jgi:hypothetical protein